MDTGQALEAQLLQLLRRLSPVARRKALRDVAVYLRRQQQTRIRRNVNPDGSAMQKRRRGNKPMFPKIGGLIKTRSSDKKAEVGLYGRTGTVASNHQLGRLMQHGDWRFELPQRELMGLPTHDKQVIIAKLLANSS